jgi:hypothetical protein
MNNEAPFFDERNNRFLLIVFVQNAFEVPLSAALIVSLHSEGFNCTARLYFSRLIVYAFELAMHFNRKFIGSEMRERKW